MTCPHGCPVVSARTSPKMRKEKAPVGKFRCLPTETMNPMGAVGFEPTKAYANGFTARPLWPTRAHALRDALGCEPQPRSLHRDYAVRPFHRQPAYRREGSGGKAIGRLQCFPISTDVQANRSLSTARTL
jgi:hypothetical protein